MGKSPEGKCPKVPDREDDGQEEMIKLRVTIDKARQFLWNQVKAEMHTILQDYWGEDHIHRLVPSPRLSLEKAATHLD